MCMLLATKITVYGLRHGDEATSSSPSLHSNSSGRSTFLLVLNHVLSRDDAAAGPASIPWLRRARRRLFRLVNHTHFEVFISVCILFGVLIMMTNHHDSSKTYDNVTEFLNHSLGGIFLVEALLKITALVCRDLWGMVPRAVLVN